MLDLRVYRTAFLPAVVALFVAAFSLAAIPASERTRSVTDAFDAERAYGSATTRDSLLELSRSFPARRPGADGDNALAQRVAQALRASGFALAPQPLVTAGRTIDGSVDLQTVVGVRPGLSNRRIVVIANRDASTAPALAELSGTAALLELTRIFRTRAPDSERATDGGAPQLVGRSLDKTLVLVSTSGGSGGDAGARAWAQTQDPELVDAVLVLGDLASARWAKPWAVPWSNGRSPAPIGWERTVAFALRQELGQAAGGSRASAQWARRALPLAASEQGEINRVGLPAVLMQVSGERGPAAAARVSRERFERAGRAALRTILAVDETGAKPFSDEPDGIVTAGRLLPGWSVRVIVLCLLAPALLVALDACFRARRRNLRIDAWLAWALAAGLIAPSVWIWLRLLAIVGLVPAPRGPVLPEVIALSSGQAAALASTAFAVAVALALVRFFGQAGRVARGDAAAGAAGAAAGLIVSAVALSTWVTNPYAAALLVPAAHIWLFLGVPATRMRGLLGWLALAAGLVAPLLVAVAEIDALRIDPLGLIKMWLLATAGGHVSALAALQVGAFCGAFAALVRVLVARRRGSDAPPDPLRLRTRGPGTYAGPGSLGGTDSALRR